MINQPQHAVNPLKNLTSAWIDSLGTHDHARKKVHLEAETPWRYIADFLRRGKGFAQNKPGLTFCTRIPTTICPPNPPSVFRA